jgi:hypothetical protein
MPSGKKHVYLEKTNDLILIFFFLNSVIFLRMQGIVLFFRFFLLQLSQTGIIKLSHSNYALTKYNIFCSLHNFILQCNMTIFYKTKLRFSFLRHRWPLPILAILFRPFGLLARKTFYIIWLSNLSILSVPDEGGAFVEQTQMNYWNCPCKTLWVLIYVQRVNFMFSVFWSLL